jgi:transcription initiation factor TFIIH subunit 3
MASKSKASHQDSTSLITVILDVSPLAWGERDLKRSAQDKARAAAGKRSVGPATLEEVIESVLTFASAANSIERDAGFIFIAVADNESAVVYPRKDNLQEWMERQESRTPDAKVMRSHVSTGIAELVHWASQKTLASCYQAAMAAALSTALCLINRFLVAAKAGGVSALQTDHFLERSEDHGVLALVGDKKTRINRKQAATWAPRILVIQASDDRSRDYNAFMNCAFAAVKHNIVVDGCFMAIESGSSSFFLEQAVDLTGGVFLAPSGAAQVGGALTEVLFSVFLAPLHCRKHLNLPALNKVDFRARCFETAQTVSQAYVCNQCLSIYKNNPSKNCPTCHAKILVDSKTRKTIGIESNAS